MAFMSTPAGKLRHPVEIQQSNKTADGYGGYTDEWAVFATARAAIWPKKSQEAVVGGKLTGIERVIIRIRHQAGITRSMRVVRVSSGTVYQILGIASVDGRDRYLDLTCKEYV